MRLVRKILLRVLGIGCVVLIGGWFALPVVLNSGYARDTAGDAIGKLLGLPVQIGNLSVGSSSTHVSLTVPDPNAEKPFIQVEHIHTDISLGGVVTGNVSPTELKIQDVQVNLRVAADGRILSPLPQPEASSGSGDSPIPAMHLSGAAISIQQEGRPEFHLTGISGDLVPDGDRYTISGTVTDANWGDWHITGHLDGKTTSGKVELSAERVIVNEAKSLSVPFVPASVWRHVVGEGEVSAKVMLEFGPGGKFEYRAEVKPRSASITVHDAEITLTEVNGVVTVIPGSVHISDTRMSLADGTVTGSATYDFSQPTGVLTAKVAMNGVDVTRLPAMWGLPKAVTGKLKGEADLELVVSPEGNVIPKGEGQGEIVGAMFNGLPAEVKLKLTGKDGRYHFKTVMGNDGPN